MNQTPPTLDDHDRRPVILVGAGGHARVLIDALLAMGRPILHALDDNAALHGQQIDGVPIVGPIDSLLQCPADRIALVNAIGSVSRPRLRRQIYEKLTRHGYPFARVLHPAAVVSPRATLSEGVQVMAGAVIQTGCLIGANSLINTRAGVDHDCTLEAHVHIAPGATLCGNVRVGDTSHVGAGAVVIQGRKIGAGAVVGAASTVLHDVADATTVVGSPARPVEPRRSA